RTRAAACSHRRRSYPGRGLKLLRATDGEVDALLLPPPRFQAPHLVQQRLELSLQVGHFFVVWCRLVFGPAIRVHATDATLRSGAEDMGWRAGVHPMARSTSGRLSRQVSLR